MYVVEGTGSKSAFRGDRQQVICTGGNIGGHTTHNTQRPKRILISSSSISYLFQSHLFVCHFHSNSRLGLKLVLELKQPLGRIHDDFLKRSKLPLEQLFLDFGRVDVKDVIRSLEVGLTLGETGRVFREVSVQDFDGLGVEELSCHL
jgi:hypothetical protein